MVFDVEDKEEYQDSRVKFSNWINSQIGKLDNFIKMYIEVFNIHLLILFLIVVPFHLFIPTRKIN